MKINLIEKVEITEYEKKLNRQLVITEVESEGEFSFTVSFEDSKIGWDGSWPGRSHVSSGTIDEALQNYCKSIARDNLYFGFQGNQVFQLQKTPCLIHTKLLNK